MQKIKQYKNDLHIRKFFATKFSISPIKIAFVSNLSIKNAIFLKISTNFPQANQNK